MREDERADRLHVREKGSEYKTFLSWRAVAKCSFSIAMSSEAYARQGDFVERVKRVGGGQEEGRENIASVPLGICHA